MVACERNFLKNVCFLHPYFFPPRMDDPESHAHHSETTVTEFFAPGLYRFKYHQTPFSRLFFSIEHAGELRIS